MDIAQMPSHCIYGMAQVRKITGEEGYFEKEVGNTVIKRMVEFDKDSSYDKKEIWTGESGDKDIFTSRPLGIKMLIDTSWNLDIYGYSGRQSAFVITPSSIKNAKGKGISYSIALIMKVADSGERLVDYVDKLIAKHPDKKTILFSNRYKTWFLMKLRIKRCTKILEEGICI